MNMKLAKGVMDVPPEEKIVKNNLIQQLQEMFEIYGFLPLETPIIERMETLTAKGGAGEDSDVFNELFRLTDQGGRKLGLRFELTTSLARYIALNPTIKKPFKRYEIGRVYRDGPIKAGRYREFWQCDVDTVGCENMFAEAELLELAKGFFEQIGFDVIIKVNNRKLLNSILKQVGVKNVNEVLVSLDKLEKIGQKGVQKELEEKGLSLEIINNIFEIIKYKTLEELEPVLTEKEGLEELKELFSLVEGLEFDVSLARGLGYYTGTIFEVFAKGSKITSSIAAGGRYDKMIGKFMGQDLPAVGLSFGLAPIMEIMKEKGLVKKSNLDVHVIAINVNCLSIVKELRDAKIKTSFDLLGRNLSKNLKLANSLEIPYCLIIGEEELKNKKVLLRDMKTGQQEKMSLKDAIKKLKK
jgi:histidyl-tRNA synthetase